MPILPASKELRLPNRSVTGVRDISFGSGRNPYREAEMPQPALHVLLAHRTLERWRRTPSLAPFRADSPGVEEHFLHGALGPDMGFFPWSDTWISRLVHGTRSGTVARTLLQRARTDAERAFAWGWVTHILADVEVHPLVNGAAIALLAREGNDQPDRHQRDVAHVRVEIGLDAWFVGSSPGAQSLRIRHAFDGRRIRFLQHALAATYPFEFPPHRLLRAHRTVTYFFGPYLALARLIANELGSTAGRGWFRLAHVRAIGRHMLNPGSQAAGFLTPVAPAADLLIHVHGALDRFHAALESHVAHGLQHLPDYDLETGSLTVVPDMAWAERQSDTGCVSCVPALAEAAA
jgi:hypothetical protein